MSNHQPRDAERFSLEEREEIKESIRRIELAVCGDKHLGIPGLAENMTATMKRVQALEDDRTRIKGGWIGIVGLCTGIAWLLSVLKDLLLSHS